MKHFLLTASFVVMSIGNIIPVHAIDYDQSLFEFASLCEKHGLQDFKKVFKIKKEFEEALAFADKEESTIRMPLLKYSLIGALLGTGGGIALAWAMQEMIAPILVVVPIMGGFAVGGQVGNMICDKNFPDIAKRLDGNEKEKTEKLESIVIKAVQERDRELIEFCNLKKQRERP
jgi:hypothetical protein